MQTSVLFPYLNPGRVSGLLFAAALLLAPLGGPHAAEPARPSGVPDAARYFAPAKVWVLEDGGKQVVWYDNGVKKAEGGWSNGQRQGEWVFYYDNGKKKGEGRFEANLKQGEWKLYASQGHLASRGPYVNNRRHGEWTFFYAGGKTEMQGPYVEGKKHGDWTNYYQSGQVFWKGAYRAGEAHGDWVYYFENGSLYQQGRYAADVRTGQWRICIHPGGPCQTESISQPGSPRKAGVRLESAQNLPRNTDDPAKVLESLDGGGVPDEVPPSVRGRWND